MLPLMKRSPPTNASVKKHGTGTESEAWAQGPYPPTTVATIASCNSPALLLTYSLIFLANYLLTYLLKYSLTYLLT